MIGFTPAQVRGMTFWEFAHARAALHAYHGGAVVEEATSSDLAEVDALLAATPARIA